MRSAHTVDHVRAAEAALMATLPEGTLMQRAATGLAHAVADLLGGVYGRRVVLLVGSGDNGGDALFAGAFLARRGAYVEAWLLGRRTHEPGLAALRAAGGIVRGGTDPFSASNGPFRPGLPPPDVVIDGIVGIGAHGPLRPEAAAALETLAGIPIVAVDVPSGVEVDTGEITGPHVAATLTVTFGTHKIAHLADPAASACGAVELVDIGLGPHLPTAPVEALQADDVAALLPRPTPDAHKYSRGVVGVRAGSERYPGAALLSVSGAACGLAGMVRYVGSAADVVKQHHPEVVGPGRVQAWVVGSGTDTDAAEHLEAALADGVPVVVDADALAHLPRPVSTGADVVLTPHAGELASLLGVERTDIESRPLEHARTAAAAYASTVLLKGRHTVIAHPDGHVRVNTTGTPWLATAGAGDVLGGLVGTLLAAGLSPFDAASTGAWLHGAAATAASAATGGGPIVASDIAVHLRAVLGGLLPG